MQKTWGDLIAEARLEIFPFPGESKPQIASHTKFFQLAAMDLQHWIPELQVNNASVFKFCSTYFNCGLTVVDAPIGLVQRVYTIANDEYCDAVHYRAADYCEVECWSKNLLTYDVPTADGLRDLPMGFRDADSSSDSTCGRARTGLWARRRHRLYIAPWIQSNESLVVEWDGVKKEWLITDVLNTELWDERVMSAIKTFVKWQHEKAFGCDDQKKLGLERDYNNERADLMHYFAEITRARGEETCCENRVPTAAEVADDSETSAADPMVFAATGDYGENNTPRDNVAALVDSWSPSWFLTLGDMFYGSTSTLADLIARTGTIYEGYNDNGIFLPTLGNHERSPAGHLDIVFSHFTFPDIATATGNVESTGYYSKSLDARLEVFVVDSGYEGQSAGGENQQADGVTEGSAQAAWLRVALARSTAKWKIVTFHHPPYSSKLREVTDVPPTFSTNDWIEYAELQWPFKDWGADAVLCGHVHVYERLEVDGFPYIISGCGGASLETEDDYDEENLSPHSQELVVGEYGALKITVDCDTLTFEWLNTDGVIKDTLELEK